MRKFCFLVLIFHLSLVTFPQCINTFPYTEGFESNNGNWISGGTADDWAWGAVAKPEITQAASGNNCWVTGGTTSSFYNFGERSYVQSPCFDFTGLQNPHVSFNIFWETERTYDGANFQYSTDGGSTWLNVGSNADAIDCLNQNWYNTASITNLTGLATIKEGWAGNVQPTNGSCQGGNGSNGWRTAQHCMPYLSGVQSVVFRFAFGAGTQCNAFDGFAFDDVTIGEAPQSIVDFTYNCAGGTYTFIGTATLCPTSFSWDFGDGNAGSGISTAHAYTAPGSFNVTFTAHSDCGVSAVTKPVNMLGTLIIPTDATCNGGNDGRAFVTAFGGSSYTYNWNTNPAQTTDTAFNLSAGTYTVTVGAPGFCDVTASVNVNQPSGISTNFVLADDTCAAAVGAVTVNVSGGNAPYTFLWSNGGTANEITNLSAGSYSVTVADVNSCSATAQTTVVFVSGIFIQFDSVKNVSCTETANGEITVLASGGVWPYTFLWSNQSADSVLKNLTPGTYRVTVADVNNCSSVDSINILQEECPSYLWFPTAFSPNSDGVNDFFKPKYSFDLEKFQMRIYNRWGELVFETFDVNEGWNGIFRNVAQPISTYVWVSEHVFGDGKKQTSAGNLTLVR